MAQASKYSSFFAWRVSIGDPYVLLKYWQLQKQFWSVFRILILLWVLSPKNMEPAFHQEDLLFLPNYEQEDIRVGEIVGVLAAIWHNKKNNVKVVP